MSRKKPNIITPYNDKGAFNDLVLNVFSDSFVSSHTPDSIETLPHKLFGIPDEN